jgi:hypothetical protein
MAKIGIIVRDFYFRYSLINDENERAHVKIHKQMHNFYFHK